MKKLNFIDSMIVYLYKWHKKFGLSDKVVPFTGSLSVFVLIYFSIHFGLVDYYLIYSKSEIHFLDRKSWMVIGVILFLFFQFLTIKDNNVLNYENDELVLRRGKRYSLIFFCFNLILLLTRALYIP
jgi:hypothetical protein